MTKVASFLFSLFLGGTVVVHNLPPVGSSALAFEPIHQSLIVKIKKDKDDDDKPKKSKPFNCKKAKCNPGEVKLDKPNIYGACCQTGTAPLTPKTTPAEPEKCKFPGEVGTPPNCTCPSGTEFMGYKGCVKKVVQRVCCTEIQPKPVARPGRAAGILKRQPGRAFQTRLSWRAGDQHNLRSGKIAVRTGRSRRPLELLCSRGMKKPRRVTGAASSISVSPIDIFGRSLIARRRMTRQRGQFASTCV